MESQEFIIIWINTELNHISSKKKERNMSTDSEGLTGSPKRRRKFLRTSDNYAVSLRKLTKRVGDLREENKKLKQELKVSKAQSKRLSDKVDHLKDVIKELVDTNLISGDALSALDKTKKTRTKERPSFGI
ncbi:hypothetical protein NQ318_014149 [Aromia moschata]|uniref:Uncharacterized protein n=1 Tax=Aromia moschata TaxID=1265417 RepID=A0AAV8X8L7_9CUCU|nr:hypothetical protein NQ318_014149 [Aromia moschata]